MARTDAAPGPSRHAAPESELALLLVGTRRRRETASARILELADAVDESALVTILVEQRVLLLAATRLAQLAPATVSGRFQERLESELARARVRAAGFTVLTTRVVEELAAAEIPAVALKGPTLAADLYGDPALRAYADIDILVPAAHLDRATRLIRGLGWTDVGWSGRRVPRLHRVLRHRDASLPEVEVHWRIHWYETRFATALLERSRMVDGLPRLSPDDQLATLLLFYARDGFTGLRYVADVAAWWDRHGSGATPAALMRLMAEHPPLAEPWRAALAAVAPVAGLPPEATPPQSRPRRQRSALAARLTNWDLWGDPDQIDANVTLIDGLLSPCSGLPAFVGRQLTRSPRWAAASIGGVPDSHLALRDRPLHLGKLLARYLLALWRLRRERYWSPPPGSVRNSSTVRRTTRSGGQFEPPRSGRLQD